MTATVVDARVLKTVECYVEPIKKVSGGYSILQRREAVMIGDIEPRLKLLKPLKKSDPQMGLVTRMHDKQFIGFFFADAFSNFDDGHVLAHEEATVDFLSKIMDEKLIYIDPVTKKIFRNMKT